MATTKKKTAKQAARKPREVKPDLVNWKQPYHDSTGCEVRESLDGTMRLVKQDQAFGVSMPLHWVIWQEVRGMWRKIYDGSKNEKRALEFAARRMAQLDEQEDDE